MATAFSLLQIAPSYEVPAPIERAHRITALDSLRGFALLGILLMNIVMMGMFWTATHQFVRSMNVRGS